MRQTRKGNKRQVSWFLIIGLAVVLFGLWCVYETMNGAHTIKIAPGVDDPTRAIGAHEVVATATPNGGQQGDGKTGDPNGKITDKAPPAIPTGNVTIVGADGKPTPATVNPDLKSFPLQVKPAEETPAIIQQIGTAKVQSYVAAFGKQSYKDPASIDALTAHYSDFLKASTSEMLAKQKRDLMDKKLIYQPAADGIKVEYKKTIGQEVFYLGTLAGTVHSDVTGNDEPLNVSLVYGVKQQLDGSYKITQIYLPNQELHEMTEQPAK